MRRRAFGAASAVLGRGGAVFTVVALASLTLTGHVSVLRRLSASSQTRPGGDDEFAPRPSSSETPAPSLGYGALGRRAAGFARCLLPPARVDGTGPVAADTAGGASAPRPSPEATNGATFLTDLAVLREHHLALLNVTRPLRPDRRLRGTLYKKYPGPRLEDHFLQRFVDEPYETFAPLVPLFVHWTEFQHGNRKAGRDHAPQMQRLLRPDVLYFAVTSDMGSTAVGLLKMAGARHVIVASSKGCAECQIVMPHLFYYQAAGFDENGRRIDLGAAAAAADGGGEADGAGPAMVPSPPLGKSAPRRQLRATRRAGAANSDGGKAGGADAIGDATAASPPPSNQSIPAEQQQGGPRTKWRFWRYDSYVRAPTLDDYRAGRATGCPPVVDPADAGRDARAEAEVARRARFAFVGSLGTHKVRKEADQLLRGMDRGRDPAFGGGIDGIGGQGNESDVVDFYRSSKFPTCSLCRDPTVPSLVSACWRVAMLRADFNLCPVGTYPVSYRLYEALQQGSVPIYLYSPDSGYFLPYRGTRADVSDERNGLGYVTTMDGLGALVERLGNASEEEVAARRASIVAVRDSHFTPRGTMEQLARWFRNPDDPTKFDVRCPFHSSMGAG